MYNLFFRLFVFLFLIIVIQAFTCTAQVLADPKIDKITGTIVDGANITIEGTGFGTKIPAAPILWETFDSGIDGDNLESHSKWSAYSSPGAEYSSIMPYGGSGLCAHNYVEYGEHEMSGFETNYFRFAGSDEIYYSYMSRHVGTDVGPNVYKNGRINSGDNTYHGAGAVAISDNYILYNPGGYAEYPSDRFFWDVEIGSSNWQRHQIYSKLSSPAGQANGWIWAQVATEKKNYPEIVTREKGYSFQYTSILLGLMCANLRSGDYHHMYVDDVYVDNTQARVEIAAGSTWASRGICDIQIPTSWNKNSITITVNQGEVEDSATKYLYVVDSNGNVNSRGFPITIGKHKDTKSLAPPSNLTIKGS